MEFLTLTDFSGTEHPAIWSSQPEPAEPLLRAMEEAEYAAIAWENPDGFPTLQALSGLGSRLLTTEYWQEAFPEAGLLISSSISGGDLEQRFRELSARRRCWLQLQPMAAVFPLPCPDGQGKPMDGLPESEGFYSKALLCRYLHSPGQVILFDTAETLEQKTLLAKECGFEGVISYP